MAAASVHTLSHSALGNITGRLIDDAQIKGAPVVHFRSIPYATIPARFKPSVILETLPESFDDRPRADFTNYGYACPAVPQKPDLYGGRLDGEEDRQYNEFACLNLTISAPQNVLDTVTRGESVKLPVMVYVHGGGFAVGAGHVSALHDTTRLVALSVKDDTPVVIVSIGYRLNWFGFLACHDLMEEAKSTSASESCFNLGLYDQRNAFLWIRRNIAGFGGDPTNITAFGESAGSGALALHACCDTPLFKRVVLESGQVGTLPSLSLDDLDQTYHRLINYLDIKSEDASSRLAALREIPAKKLVEAIPHVVGNFFSPYAMDPDPNGFFGGKQPTYWTAPALVQNCSWLDDIILGDTHFEGEVLASVLRMVDHTLFVSHMKHTLGVTAAERLLHAYDIPVRGKMDANLFWYKLMELMGDFMFGEPTERLANSLTIDVATHGKVKKVYRYFMCLSNPNVGTGLVWPTGQHCIEVMYLFLTLLSRYPPWRDNFLRRQAFETARRWLRFANGTSPWDEYTGNNIAICDDLRGWQTRTIAEDEEISREDPWGPRRYDGRRAWKEVFEEIAKEGDVEGIGRRIEQIRLKMLDFGSYLARG